MNSSNTLSDKMHFSQNNWKYVLTLMICVVVSKQSVVVQIEGPQENLTSIVKPVNNSEEVNHRKGRCELKNKL